MVLLLALGPVLLPEHRDTQAGRLDPRGVAAISAALLIGVAILAVTLLRHVRLSAEAAEFEQAPDEAYVQTVA